MSENTNETGSSVNVDDTGGMSVESGNTPVESFVGCLMISVFIAALIIMPLILFTEVGDLLMKSISSEVTTRSSKPTTRKVIVRVETPQGPRVGSSVIKMKGYLAKGSGQRVLLPNGDQLFVPPLSRFFIMHWRDEGKVPFSCDDVRSGGTWSPTGYVVRDGIIIAQVGSCDMGWYGREHGYSMRVVSMPTKEDAGMETYPGWSNSTESAKKMDPLWKLDARLAEKSVPFRKDAVRPSMGGNSFVDKSQMYEDDF